MRWNRPVSGVGPGQSRLVIVTVIVVAVMIPVLLSVGAGDQKRISIYSGSANYTLNVQDRDGKEYVDLLEILQPLGATSIKSDRSSWRLRFGNAESEFIPEKARARIRGSDFDLPGKFKLENGRGLVPLASLSTLLPQFLGAPVAFRESSRRLFIGNVSVHFVAQVNRANPPSLVMEFSSPVNPMIATEPGKLRMIFTHEPLVPPGSQTLTFDSKIIPSANYAESNGAAEIAVNSSVPLLASFSNDGRTITIAPAPQRELEARGLSTQLVRDSDVSLTVEQRAILTNAAHPTVYICLHASSEGNGVRLYTAMLPAGAESRGPFLDWDTAQSASRATSQVVETSLATEFEKRQVAVRSLMAPLRPLNNVTTAAIAIEVASPASGIVDLNSPQYQQLISESIASGVLAVRDKLGAAR